MIVGVPTEVKPDEYRVAITPIGVRELTEHGHQVLIQKGAGEGSAISDSDYEAQGARIIPTPPRSSPSRRWCSGSRSPSRRRSGCCARARRCSPTCTWRRRRS